MTQELKKKTTEELQKSVVDMRESLRVIRHTAAGSRSRNVRESRLIRRDIARSLTELRARSLSSAKAGLATETKTA